MRKEENVIADIRFTILNKIQQGYKKFVIFPFGDVGMRVKEVLNVAYGLQEQYIVDNELSKYNPNIKGMDFFAGIDVSEYVVFLACTNSSIYSELKNQATMYFEEEQIAELSLMKSKMNPNRFLYHTVVGKYSYGPICKNHPLIESIGAFCSFAEGVDVVANHETDFLTTHPMIYAGKHIDGFDIDYNVDSDKEWFFPGVTPKELVTRTKRSKIGNDVWLGKNVTITKGANIGNGVIAGAGTIITKDIPDYAVVVGVPARIIRFRYSIKEIEALNEIKWWDWPDDKIRERYDDFYLPISEFIEKWRKEER